MPFRTLLAALLLLALPAATHAQASPEFPGLRGLTRLQAYVGFIGRPEALAECGISEAYVASLFDVITATLAPAGTAVPVGTERMAMQNGLLLRSRGYVVGEPTLAVTVATLSLPGGQGPICVGALGFAIRAQATGTTVTGTGTRFDGEAVLWTDDAAQMREGPGLPRAVTESLTTIIQGLAGSIREAAGVVAACPMALNQATDPAASFTCSCSPAQAAAVGPVWGVDVYTDDSLLCRAAVHAGAIGAAGGVVTVNRAPGQNSYPGGSRNGVTTSPYGPWTASFRFGAARPANPTQGGGAVK